MRLLGYYTPEKNNQIVRQDFVGQNMVKMCEDIDPRLKTSWFPISHQPMYPGHLATFAYVPGEVEFTTSAGKSVRTERAFLLDAEMIKQVCAGAHSQNQIFTVLWMMIYAGVRQFVQRHKLSTDQLLGAHLMEDLVRRHPRLKLWQDTLLEHYVQGNMESESYVREIDSQIVCLIAGSMTMTDFTRGDHCDYPKVRQVLETTRQTFDENWLNLN